jgi:predicted nucleic acid-binding protein
MPVRVFVDTNVLVYSRDASEGHKQKQAIVWIEYLWRQAAGCLSFQVLQEFYVTVTEKLDPGLARDIARSDVRSLLAWHPLPVEHRIVEGAWAIQDRYRLSWWDSLIVSAAQVADCQFLLTEDLQRSREFGSVQVIDPFQTSPASLKL